MSYIGFLLALARSLGPKLEAAWPYIVAISQALRKIYEISHGSSLTISVLPEDATEGKKGKKKGKLKASGAEVDELLALAESHGVEKEAMREVADVFKASEK